ncbi:MAG TPA: hypothetical protein VFW94_19135, partial [Candidatus Acidoferrales bacterium]|nr:hypothetical protein [Candidatus Acidoferrales bacterium]
MGADVRETSPGGHIVRATTNTLAIRSAALVARGLRDLARNANWLTAKVFAGRSAQLALSPHGHVSAVAPQRKGEPQRLVVYDAERGAPTIALTVPNEAVSFSSQLGARAAFAWSPSAQFLVAAWGLWEPALHLFDMHSKMFLGTFGEFAEFPRYIRWSDLGRYFVLSG